ncbi:MAG TPA: LLM class F420-dependent oxidoreductase, partial [Acidimicrobiales bacterium]|nr:LLM class F420-dependent oxidoreductase [Acidimicrobiales bacterium]
MSRVQISSSAPMKIGLYSINGGHLANPDDMGRVAVAAEEAGFESLWTAEHVVLPDPQVPPSPLPAEVPLLDPAVALAYLSSITTKINLGTGIIILPQRNPLVLAKELASVDALSKGRLIFGVGVGYLAPEFEALGIPMKDRGPRSIEYIEAMRSIWHDNEPNYDGKYVSFSGVKANPRPISPLGPPVVMGGHSKPAWRRTVTHCQGWYGFMLDPEGTAKNIAGIRELEGQHERSEGLGKIEITVTPLMRPGVEML